VALRSDGSTLVQCRLCSLCHISPRPEPDEVADYYKPGYFLGQSHFFQGSNYCLERDRAITRGETTGYKELLRAFDLEGKSILDIGCGSGALLQLLKPFKPKALVGVDIAEYPVAWGRKRYGLDLRCCPLGDACFPTASFDLVLLIDVVEHVHDLRDFTTELRRILSPGGAVFVVTPNYDSMKLAGKAWVPLHRDYEHLQYFGTRSMEQLCRRVGFAVASLWTDGCPISLKSYPKLYRFGLHRLKCPQVALVNGLSRLRYEIGKVRTPDCGLNLFAVCRPMEGWRSSAGCGVE